MNQQEWIEYFELVNGRKPTPAELSQAQAAGEFILERPNVFGATGQANEPRNIKPAEPVISMTQQPQFAQTTATFQQAMPVKKGMSKKAKIILASVLGAVAVILLSVGGYSLWRYQSGKIADGTYEVVAYSYRDEDKDKMVNAFDEFDDVYSFVEVKNNRSRYYSYLEDNKSPYVSLLEYEHEIPQQFDPWNKTQTEVLTVEELESTVKDFMKDMSKDYSFYTKDATKEAVKSYKKSLKEKRTYVKKGDEYTLSTYDKDGELQSRVTFKRMSKGDAEERWDDYKDAIKDYKKELKTYSDQYDEYKDYFNYGYGGDYGYGYSDDYGSGSKSGSDDSKSSKKGIDKI